MTRDVYVPESWHVIIYEIPSQEVMMMQKPFEFIAKQLHDMPFPKQLW